MHNKNLKKGKLYLVATPIGNLADITYRAISILSMVDLIATEDTRQSAKLLNYYSIKTPTFSYHKFNEKEKLDFIYNKILKGKNIALVSDAGTPSISDPGDILVNFLRDKSVDIEPIPGPSSITASLSVSGFGSKEFSFISFFPKKIGNRKDILDQFLESEKTLIFFESPKRIKKTLIFIKNYFGKNIKILICKEITKKNELISFDTIEKHVKNIEDNNLDKGEFVILLPPLKLESNNYLEIEKLMQILNKNKIPKSAVVKILSEYFDIRKNSIYNKII